MWLFSSTLPSKSARIINFIQSDTVPLAESLSVHCSRKTWPYRVESIRRQACAPTFLSHRPIPWGFVYQTCKRNRKMLTIALPLSYNTQLSARQDSNPRPTVCRITNYYQSSTKLYAGISQTIRNPDASSSSPLKLEVVMSNV